MELIIYMLISLALIFIGWTLLVLSLVLLASAAEIVVEKIKEQ